MREFVVTDKSGDQLMVNPGAGFGTATIMVMSEGGETVGVYLTQPQASQLTAFMQRIAPAPRVPGWEELADGTPVEILVGTEPYPRLVYARNGEATYSSPGGDIRAVSLDTRILRVFREVVSA